MSKLKCAVVDDEPIARRGLKNFIDKVDFLEFEGFAKDVDTLLQMLSETEIDLIFLDIEMPGISGIEFVKEYTEKLPLIIFITAYQEFAVESYNLHAVDYLLKPTSFERFLDAANRALEIWTIHHSKQGEKDFFFLRHEGLFKKIVKTDIAFISAMQNYVHLHMEVGRPLMVHYSLKSIQSYLDDNFIMIHKSYIVNLDYVEAVAANTVTLAGHGQVPIGRHYKAEVVPKLMGQ